MAYEVTIPKNEYNKLVRESEKLAIIRDIVEENSYFSSDTIKKVLGKKEEGENNESV